MEKIDKKREDLRGKIDSEFDLICSFNPKITNEKGEYYIIKNKKKKKIWQSLQYLEDFIKM